MNKPRRDRVLVVEDCPIHVRILVDALQMHYEVIAASSAEEALEVLERQEPPDIVLLDIMLPGASGRDVCRALKQSARNVSLPVIYITAKNHEKDETRGFEDGAVDYIIKPFSVPVVQARVRTHLELKRHRDMLEGLSSMDGLTGVANRRRFDESLGREWRRSARTRTPLSLLLADIDFFKQFNDTHGHLAGDDCLKAVARSLASGLRRPGDLLARYGGEEFAALLPETDADGAYQVAENLRCRVESLHVRLEHSEKPVRVTVSLGAAAMIPIPAKNTPGALVDAADKALYQAKRQGRNRSVRHDRMES